MRPINSCLNNQLLRICEQARVLENLTSTLKRYLPVDLVSHCQVVSFNKGQLVLGVDDAVWATPLRYHLPILRDTLRTEVGLYQLISTKVIVLDSVSKPVTQKRKRIGLSCKAYQVIRSAADLCSYQPLKEALKHLGTPRKPEDIK